MKTQKTVSQHPKGAFRAQKTLQKSRCSVLRQMRALFSIPRLLLSKKPNSSDITSKVRIERVVGQMVALFSNLRLLLSRIEITSAFRLSCSLIEAYLD